MTCAAILNRADSRAGPFSSWVAAGLLFLLTVLVYLPALRGGFIWDDDYYVTQNWALRDINGLRRIWLEIGATPQYYPLVHTTFWVEYQIWHLNALGYHAVNIVLHAFAVLLLWRVLVLLQLPGAWLAASIFAVHPVGVESVAWITERKNVLSAVFYFAAALAWFRFQTNWESRKQKAEMRGRAEKTFNIQHPTSNARAWYGLALALFVCALLSKTVACSLPAALLLVIWWKRGRLTLRDVLPTIPFFAVGLALGLNTAAMEKHTVGAVGADWAFTFADRCLIAGRALWFYAGKLVWPSPLVFIYPRWEINTAVWWQWIFPIAALAVIAVLFALRKKIGRGPVVAVLFFCGTLFPALGFVNVYPMRFSFVADHFQYLAGVGLIALGAVGLDRLRKHNQIPAVVVLLVLGVLTWRQCRVYGSIEQLWIDTLAKNPACWMAHNNLGGLLTDRSRYEEGEAHFLEAIRLKPDYAEPVGNLGRIALGKGRTEEAIKLFHKAIALFPNYEEAWDGLGSALLAKGQTDEAIEAFRNSLRIRPNNPSALNNLGAALADKNRLSESLACYEASIRLEPDNTTIRFNIATTLFQIGRTNEAMVRFREVLKQYPNEAPFQSQFGFALKVQGMFDEALVHFRAAVRLDPQFAEAHYHLGDTLARMGRRDEAIVELQEAIRLKPENQSAKELLRDLGVSAP